MLCDNTVRLSFFGTFLFGFLYARVNVCVNTFIIHQYAGDCRLICRQPSARRVHIGGHVVGTSLTHSHIQYRTAACYTGDHPLLEFIFY